MRLGRGIVVGVVGLLTMVSSLAGPARRVGATPTALAAKALPDLLAPDEGSLALFPASASGFAACLLYDRREVWGSSLVANVGGEDSWYVEDTARQDFALALAGRGALRAGYLLDGDTHTLLLAGVGGWGLSFGWRQYVAGNEYESVWMHDSLTWGSHYGNELKTREARVGAEWMMRSPSGRTFEVAMAGGVVDGTTEWWGEDPTDSIATRQPETWDLRGGVRFEVAARTATSRPGLLLAAHYRRDRWDARNSGRPGWTDSFEQGVLQSGWRMRPGAVDEVLVGIEVLRSRSEESKPRVEPKAVTVDHTVSTDWTGVVFISMQERVGDFLTLRGGVRTPFMRDVTEREYASPVEPYKLGDPEWEVVNTRKVMQAMFGPDIRLGGGWRWRSLDVEAWVQNDFSWDAPLMRWAARVSF